MGASWLACSHVGRCASRKSGRYPKDPSYAPGASPFLTARAFSHMDCALGMVSDCCVGAMGLAAKLLAW